jgi:hypothetical protein
MSQLEVPTTIPVPSADLINYRFDEADKKFATMSNKLDQILLQNSQFVTESHVEKMIDDATQPFKDTIANYRWYWRTVFTAMLLCMGGVIAALIQRH